jgi:hypothetical protein
MIAKKIPQSCPYCQGPMSPIVMECPACHVEVRGRFRASLFHLLPPEDQELLERYLLAGFSIKALEDQSDMGYAAIRTRLDRLIDHYRRLRSGEAEKSRLLEQVASGELTAQEAAERIAKLDEE